VAVETPDTGGTVVNMLNVPSTSTAANIISTCFYSSSASTSWMLDSGCSDHITPHIEDFTEYLPLTTPGHITLGNKSTMSYLGVGLVNMDCIINSTHSSITFKHVLFAPQAGHRFISVSKLDTLGFIISYSKEKPSYLTQEPIG